MGAWLKKNHTKIKKKGAKNKRYITYKKKEAKR